jgi:hydroxylamine reductase (hybrid-cluster protein)
MGPCRTNRLGNGPQEGLCGANADTIVARNLTRMIAGGAAAHSDHRRDIVHTVEMVAKDPKNDYRNIIKQGLRAATADGWGGSMIATELSDVLFGSPNPLQARANLGVLKKDQG